MKDETSDFSLDTEAGGFLWELMEEFLTSLKVRGYSQQTLSSYRLDLRHLWRWLVLAKNLRSLTDVGRDELMEYAQGLMLPRGEMDKRPQVRHPDKPWSAGTRNRHLSTVRVFFKYLVKSGRLLSNPASELEGFRAQKKLPAVPSPKEILKLLAVVDTSKPQGLRNRCLFELMYACGLRVSELLGLDLGDIDFSGQTLHVRAGKYGKDRILPLLSESERVLKNYLALSRPHLKAGSSKALFVSVNGKRLSRDSVSWVLKRYSEKAKLKTPVTAHTFRHCCATHLLQKKVSLRHIQALLGHKSLATTQLYTKLEISDLQEVIRRCHPRETF